MPVHKEIRVVACRCDQFFDLVADVESYPEFLPFWRLAHVYRREGDVYYTDQQIGIGLFVHQRFRSCTKLDRPSDIAVTSDEGVFKDFRIYWHFDPLPEDSCRVEFTLSCQARSLLLSEVMDLMLLETARTMVSAFESRARKLYDPGKKLKEKS